MIFLIFIGEHRKITGNIRKYQGCHPPARRLLWVSGQFLADRLPCRCSNACPGRYCGLAWVSNLCEPCSWCGTKSFLLFGFGHQGPCRLVGVSCGGCLFGASRWAFGSKCRKQGFFGFPFRFASDFLLFLSFFLVSLMLLLG